MRLARPQLSPKVTRGLHPDQEDAAIRLGDAFGRAFGTDVKVKPRGAGYTVALSFDSLDEALQLAERLAA